MEENAMNHKMSSLLKVVADYHSFCNPDKQSAEARFSPRELTESELDYIAAAAKAPTMPADNEKK